MLYLNMPHNTYGIPVERANLSKAQAHQDEYQFNALNTWAFGWKKKEMKEHQNDLKGWFLF